MDRNYIVLVTRIVKMEGLVQNENQYGRCRPAGKQEIGTQTRGIVIAKT